MRKLESVLLTGMCLLAAHTCGAHISTSEYAVQVSATVRTSPAEITLNWPQDNQGAVSGYTVYRKSLDGKTWGDGITLSRDTTQYVDTNVSVGGTYEYEVVESAPSRKGYGYIYAGIKAPLVESRGKLVLVVDDTYAAALSNELVRLEEDLV